MKKLAQVLAVEKPLKQKVNAESAALHKTAQKADLFDGHAKTYKPLAEEGEQLPPDNKKVQSIAADDLQAMGALLSQWVDVTASKDFGNTVARATVVVDGQTLVENAPVPFLLFLEKQLDDWVSFVRALPVLDAADDWNEDANSRGLYRTEKVVTARQVKLQEPLVLVQATDKHPAQAQLITKDHLVGYWEKVRLSEALPQTRQKTLLSAAEKLRNAVKEAVEEANGTRIEEQRVGDTVFAWLLKAL